MLALLGAERAMAAPILAGGKVRGFLELDNPRQNTGDLLLLSVAASVCYREISRSRRQDAKLEQAEREMTDKVNQGLADQRSTQRRDG